MNSHRIFRTAAVSAVIAVSAAFLAAPPFAHAQTEQAERQQADAPALVGRVAYVSGGVQIYSEAEPEWRVAQLNEPVTSRNSLFTGSSGRAEVRIGSAAVSLAENTQIDIGALDEQIFDGRLVRGSISVRLAQIEKDDLVRIETPDGAFELQKAGRYRIDADSASSAVTVFAGQARALGNSGSVQVDTGKSLRLANAGGQEDFAFGAAVTTPFDNWTLARDRSYREGQSIRYVSRNMTGYEELDANGRWDNDPEYGPLWYPTTYVRADWAPYRYGHWGWVAPWGWTWIDDAPWGFAPFHYGRWVSLGGRWAWTPGGYVARPVFAPALVGFYGGADFSLSFSIGGSTRFAPAVGWYPLAPWERFSPYYTRNPRYIDRINSIGFVDGRGRAGRRWDERRRQDLGEINRVRGATVVRRDDFGNRAPAARLASRITDQDLIRRATVVPAATALPDRPQRRVSARDVQPKVGQPNLGQPNVGQPNVGQANVRQPNPGQPNFVPGLDSRARPGYDHRSDRLGHRERAEIARPEVSRPEMAPMVPQDPRARPEIPHPETAPMAPRDPSRSDRRLYRQAEPGSPQPDLGRWGQSRRQQDLNVPQQAQQPARVRSQQDVAPQQPEVQHQVQRREIQRPEIQRPEIQRSEVQRPEVRRPDVRRPEAQHPNEVLQRQQEAARIEQQRNALRIQAAPPVQSAPASQAREIQHPQQPQQPAAAPQPQPSRFDRRAPQEAAPDEPAQPQRGRRFGSPEGR